MSDWRLVIGNCNYSSWSLRAWLALREAGVAFDEIRVPLDTDEFEARIGELSPTRCVPALWVGEQCVWDSLAIGETIADRFPEAGLRPQDPDARAHMRSINAEMHSGFSTLRREMPMNIRATKRNVPITDDLTNDIARIQAIWEECREMYGDKGEWLFGEFSLADCMYVPVAMRFLTYGVSGSSTVKAYLRTVAESRQMRRWIIRSHEEAETIEHEEVGR